MKKIQIRTVEVVRYIQPLREGGSLPAIVEADDGFLYVLKFRGAGQGTKALVAELIGCEIARAIGLNVPEVVFMILHDLFSKTESDEEIQDLLKFSVGLNLGLHFLSGAITYDPLVSFPDALTASKLVLLDSLISNIDRTVKNTNLLHWNNELWLIDHGASLYFHHNWPTWKTHIGRNFPNIKDHVMVKRATELERAANHIQKVLDSNIIDDIINSVPHDWLEDSNNNIKIFEMKAAYKTIINNKLSILPLLIKDIRNAQ